MAEDAGRPTVQISVTHATRVPEVEWSVLLPRRKQTFPSRHPKPPTLSHSTCKGFRTYVRLPRPTNGCYGIVKLVSGPPRHSNGTQLWSEPSPTFNVVRSLRLMFERPTKTKIRNSDAKRKTFGGDCDPGRRGVGRVRSGVPFVGRCGSRSTPK